MTTNITTTLTRSGYAGTAHSRPTYDGSVVYIHTVFDLGSGLRGEVAEPSSMTVRTHHATVGSVTATGAGWLTAADADDVRLGSFRTLAAAIEEVCWSHEF